MTMGTTRARREARRRKGVIEMGAERLNKLQSLLDEVGEENARAWSYNSEEMGRERGLQEAVDIMTGEEED